MSLRELKKEVERLPELRPVLQQFHRHWIKPIRSNTNPQFPTLQFLSSDMKKKINQELSLLSQCMKPIQQGQHITNKLQNYASSLVELKLTTLNGDRKKSRRITHTLLHDDFLGITQTIVDIKAFEESLSIFNRSYNTITGLLYQNLPLDESLYFQDLSHSIYISRLLRISHRQKKLAKELGKQFVSLVREIEKKK